MYNGIGVQTARGTGTSGHVVKNLSALRPSRPDMNKLKATREKPVAVREADPGIIHHNALRSIEVSLLKRRDELEEEYVHALFYPILICRGLSENEIDARISKMRDQLRLDMETHVLDGSSSSAVFRDSHSLSIEKQAENARVAAAFGIATDQPDIQPDELAPIQVERSRSRSRSGDARRNRRRRSSSNSSSASSARGRRRSTRK